MDKKYSDSPAFALTRYFWIYLAALFFALVFTQALRSTASSMMFYFMLLLPIFLLIYALIARVTLKVYLTAEETTAQKYSPVEYEFDLINESILPYPFLEAVISVPGEDGVRCTEKMFSVSAPPSGKYVFKNRSVFKYRGSYEIGVSCIYIYDFFKLFRMRLDVGNYTTIIVLPRKLRLDETASTSVTDIPTDSARVVAGTDQSEIGNIREYRMGDPLKSIHWKLSSKTQDLQVKEYNTNTGKSIYIFADFARAPVYDTTPAVIAPPAADNKRKKRVKRVKLDMEAVSAPPAEPLPGGEFDEGVEAAAKSPELDPAALAEAEAAKARAEFDYAKANLVKPEYAGDMDEFVADGVTELAVATVLRELRAGNASTLVCFDAREPSGIAAYELTSPEDFENIFKNFATTPLAPSDDRVMRLAPVVRESMNVTVRVVTGAIDTEAVSGYAALPAMFGGAGTGSVTEVLVFNPDERYADPAARVEYIGLCRSRLAQNGVVLTQLRTGELQ